MKGILISEILRVKADFAAMSAFSLAIFELLFVFILKQHTKKQTYDAYKREPFYFTYTFRPVC